MSREHVTTPLAAFSDWRGAISNILSGPALPVRHVAVITSRAGAVRGNHFHPHDEQWMYCLSGSYAAYSQQAGSPDAPIEFQVISAGQLAFCPPGIAHAYVFLEDTVFLNLAPEPRIPGKPEESQVRHVLVQERDGGENAPPILPVPKTLEAPAALGLPSCICGGAVQWGGISAYCGSCFREWRLQPSKFLAGSPVWALQSAPWENTPSRPWPSYL